MKDSGFGKIYPCAQNYRDEESCEEEDEIPSEFISQRELEKGHMSRDGTLWLSVFSTGLFPTIFINTFTNMISIYQIEVIIFGQEVLETRPQPCRTFKKLFPMQLYLSNSFN